MLQFVSDERTKGNRWTRREWLRIGGLGGLGLGVPRRPSGAAERDSAAVQTPGFGRAKSVIVVFANGGQSQFETWDPKPDAPREIRGEFDSIRTAIPGTRLCEHMPRLARLADRYTIVRSISHEDLDHGSAFYLAMTGHYHNRRSANPPPSPADFPAFAGILKRVRPNREFVHTGVHINGPAQVPELVGPGQFGGFLGREYDPMIIGDVTARPILIPGLTPREDLPQVRMRARQSLLDAIDECTGRLEQNRLMMDMSTLYQQAFQMLSSPQARKAFDLTDEPDGIRNRYGRNRSGQACLLARRLVEVGIPLVTVFWNHTNRGQDTHPGETDFYGWDTHNDIFQALKVHLLPRFDLSFAALLDDLEQRGLLDETLVVCMGEFGRAPLVALEPRFAGASPGRKHWASVYSIVFAGAGVGRGQVVGESDRAGAHPASVKFGPWDVIATIFSALGIDPHGHYTDATGRPFPISTGRPMTELYS